MCFTRDNNFLRYCLLISFLYVYIVYLYLFRYFLVVAAAAAAEAAAAAIVYKRSSYISQVFCECVLTACIDSR